MKRFPEDFMFQLEEPETEKLVSQTVIPHKKYFGGLSRISIRPSNYSIVLKGLQQKALQNSWLLNSDYCLLSFVRPTSMCLCAFNHLSLFFTAKNSTTSCFILKMFFKKLYIIIFSSNSPVFYGDVPQQQSLFLLARGNIKYQMEICGQDAFLNPLLLLAMSEVER